MASSPSSSPDGADEIIAPEAQVLPEPLSSQLASHTRAVFHSSAATRVLFVGEARSRAPTRALADFQFDVVHIGQVAHLLHSWGRIFAQIQQAAPTHNPRLNPAASSDEWQDLLLRMSRAYRAELESCLVDAAAQLQSHDGQADPALLAELSAHNIALDDFKYTLLLLETCKSLFHLVEVFYIDPHLNLTAQLVDWTHRTLQMPRVELTEDEENEGLDPAVMRDRDSYWSCVYRMLLQGRLYEALQLLESCEELVGADSPYQKVMRGVLDAIESVPAIAHRQQAQGAGTQGDGASEPQVPLEQFLHSFHSWQRFVRDLRSSPALTRTPHEHIDLLLSLLLGDEQSMLQAAQSNYLELFLGTLLYVKPHVQNSRREMQAILERCMQLCEEQWKRDRAYARQQEGEDAAEEDDASEELYTPLDTLRFHLISSDISRALAVMNDMIELRFFLAHVVHLLHEQGDTIHHESETEVAYIGGRAMQVPKPLRLEQSAINDRISLLEFHLISYAETLEAASRSIVGSNSEGGCSAGQELLWLLAVEYYAACPENGRGYLVNLLRRQPVTSDRVQESNEGTSVMRRVDHRKVHRLLALAMRFRLREEYNNVLIVTGNICALQGADALRIASGATGTTQNDAAAVAEADVSAFGQAAHWYSMLQPESGSCSSSASVSFASVSKMESLAEVLLDHLLLRQATTDADLFTQRLALQGIVGLLAHVPGSLLVPLDVLTTPDVTLAPLVLGRASPLLSFCAGFFAYRALWLRLQNTAREIDALKAARLAAAGGETARALPTDDDGVAAMDEDDSAVAAPARAGPPSLAHLFSLLSLHAHLHAGCLSLLLSLLRHADTLLAAQRKYWLSLVLQLVHLVEERAPSLSRSQKGERRARRAQAASLQPRDGTATYFELQHPAYAAPAATLPAPSSAAAAALLPSTTLAHVQRLLTMLLHSNSAQQYSESIGGAQGIKRVQHALSSWSSQATQQRHA